MAVNLVGGRAPKKTDGLCMGLMAASYTNMGEENDSAEQRLCDLAATYAKDKDELKKTKNGLLSQSDVAGLKSFQDLINYHGVYGRNPAAYTTEFGTFADKATEERLREKEALRAKLKSGATQQAAQAQQSSGRSVVELPQTAEPPAPLVAPQFGAQAPIQGQASPATPTQAAAMPAKPNRIDRSGIIGDPVPLTAEDQKILRESDPNWRKPVYYVNKANGDVIEAHSVNFEGETLIIDSETGKRINPEAAKQKGYEFSYKQPIEKEPPIPPEEIAANRTSQFASIDSAIPAKHPLNNIAKSSYDAFARIGKYKEGIDSVNRHINDYARVKQDALAKEQLAMQRGLNYDAKIISIKTGIVNSVTGNESFKNFAQATVYATDAQNAYNDLKSGKASPAVQGHLDQLLISAGKLSTPRKLLFNDVEGFLQSRYIRRVSRVHDSAKTRIHVYKRWSV